MPNAAMLQKVLDRSADIGLIIDEMLDHWSYDLYTRKPAPALLENGILTPTDLDMACFLSALAARGAVINIPKYTRRRPKTMREGEIVVSPENRHGKVVGLTANRSVFSFSIRIRDANVMTTDEVGAFRNFMLIDLDGTPYEGWTNINFIPTAKENDWLNDKKLWTEHHISFKHFVHPNRWSSVYGSYYILTKLLEQRLGDYTTFLRSEKERLEELKIELPKTETERVYPPSTTESGEAIKVKAFEAEIDAPFTGEFKPVPNDALGMAYVVTTIKNLSYNVIPRLRFANRSCELAFFLAGCKERSLPKWSAGNEWQSDYVIQGKRIHWERLAFNPDSVPGHAGIFYRYRVWEKTERVSE